VSEDAFDEDSDGQLSSHSCHIATRTYVYQQTGSSSVRQSLPRFVCSDM
jgi:hypothetical protein